MTGVEILSYEIIYHSVLPWWCGLIAFVAMFILIMVFANSYTNGGVISKCVSLFMLISAVATMFIALSPDKTNIDYIKYKVTIDEFVSMDEFMEKYTLLEQEGKIYTVKEKTQ